MKQIKKIKFISDEISILYPRKDGETPRDHLKRLLEENKLNRIHLEYAGIGRKGWNDLLHEFNLVESVRPKTDQDLHRFFFNRYYLGNTERLAEACLTAVARGESPEIFWGDRHATILEKCMAYIKSIGVLEAEELFVSGKLVLPSWVTE